jgi:hypothetical protein
MILDADLTVMPEELPFFFRALVSNRGEFINGSRLVYPLPKAAMKLFNRLGNQVFGFHHEPLGLENDIEWTAGQDFCADNAGYYTVQGMPAESSLGKIQGMFGWMGNQRN